MPVPFTISALPLMLCLTCFVFAFFIGGADTRRRPVSSPGYGVPILVLLAVLALLGYAIVSCC